MGGLLEAEASIPGVRSLRTRIGLRGGECYVGLSRLTEEIEEEEEESHYCSLEKGFQERGEERSIVEGTFLAEEETCERRKGRRNLEGT